MDPLQAVRGKNPGGYGPHLIPLRHAADWRTLVFLTALIALFVVQWTGWCRYWALLPLTCVLAFVACVAKHNHIHCRTFRRPGWNRGFEFLLSLGTGQSITAIIPVHNERHHAQSHTDEDCVRSTLVNHRWNWVNLMWFPFKAVWLVYRNKPADMARWRAQKASLYHRARQERLLVLGLGLLLLVFDWRATLLYLGLPWVFGHWGIVTINLLQHQDCDHGSEYDHSRNVTGRALNWLCLNNGFHTAHHLRPALHWSRLPEWHERMVAPRMRADLNHTSLIWLVWKQFLSPARRTR
jgi:fatty acid desaturase